MYFNWKLAFVVFPLVSASSQITSNRNESEQVIKPNPESLFKDYKRLIFNAFTEAKNFRLHGKNNDCDVEMVKKHLLGFQSNCYAIRSLTEQYAQQEDANVMLAYIIQKDMKNFVYEDHRQLGNSIWGYKRGAYEILKCLLEPDLKSNNKEAGHLATKIEQWYTPVDALADYKNDLKHGEILSFADYYEVQDVVNGLIDLLELTIKTTRSSLASHTESKNSNSKTNDIANLKFEIETRLLKLKYSLETSLMNDKSWISNAAFKTMTCDLKLCANLELLKASFSAHMRISCTIVRNFINKLHSVYDLAEPNSILENLGSENDQETLTYEKKLQADNKKYLAATEKKFEHTENIVKSSLIFN